MVTETQELVVFQLRGETRELRACGRRAVAERLRRQPDRHPPGGTPGGAAGPADDPQAVADRSGRGVPRPHQPDPDGPGGCGGGGAEDRAAAARRVAGDRAVRVRSSLSRADAGRAAAPVPEAVAGSVADESLRRPHRGGHGPGDPHRPAGGLPADRAPSVHQPSRAGGLAQLHRALGNARAPRGSHPPPVRAVQRLSEARRMEADGAGRSGERHRHGARRHEQRRDVDQRRQAGPRHHGRRDAVRRPGAALRGAGARSQRLRVRADRNLRGLHVGAPALDQDSRHRRFSGRQALGSTELGSTLARQGSRASRSCELRRAAPRAVSARR